MSEETLSTRRLYGPLLTVIIGIFMVVLDSTAMNVALGALERIFEAPLHQVQWTITAYTLAQATVIPLAGWLSDRYGAKRMFLLSLILFILASLLCATASTIWQLIVFRIIQGLGGGMLMPIATAMIYRLSPPDKVGSIMGIVGLPILLAPALGPIVGGYFVDRVSWHGIFLLNIPVGILAIILAWRILPQFERKRTDALDRWGIVLGPLAFAALTFGISEGGESWTSSATIGGISIGLLALGSFIYIELTLKTEPLLELRVFRSPQFRRALITQWLMQFVMFGSIFLIPYYMQRAMGTSALEAGMWTLPQALMAALCMPFGGKLYDRFGIRPLILIGMTSVATGAWLLSGIEANGHAIDFLLPRMLLGLGMGLSYMSLNTYLIQTAPRSLISRVTSLTSAMQQVISSLAIAGLTSFIVVQIERQLQLGTHPQEALVIGSHLAFLMLMGTAIGAFVLGMTLRRHHHTTTPSRSPPDPIEPSS